MTFGWEPERYHSDDTIEAIRNGVVLKQAHAIRQGELDYTADKTAEALAQLLGPPLVAIAQQLNLLRRGK